MGVLKKGSKGNPVRELQTLLNKNGAKPPLKIDGDFGPKTDAATRAFQKQTNEKVDGKAGDRTLAALRYGGPLPVMTVQDHHKFGLEFRGKAISHDQTLDHFDQLRAEVNTLAKVLNTQLPKAEKIIDGNIEAYRVIFKVNQSIAAKQAKFEDLVLKNPKAAAALVKECAALDKKLMAVHQGTYRPNVRKASRATSASASQIEKSLEKIGASITALKIIASGGYA